MVMGVGFRARLHFVNETDEVQQVGLTPNFPAKIVPVDLAKLSGPDYSKRRVDESTRGFWGSEPTPKLGTACPRKGSQNPDPFDQNHPPELFSGRGRPQTRIVFSRPIGTIGGLLLEWCSHPSGTSYQHGSQSFDQRHRASSAETPTPTT